MRLFIAEKPSVAKAISEVLGVTDKKSGYLVCGEDYITWCFGHMLESVEPDYYLPDDIPKDKNGRKIWREEDLPIIPLNNWIKVPKKECEDQLNIIGKLIKNASEIVHAGDPDREGQLLVDDVLEHFNNKSPVLRYWVNAIDKISIERGLESLKNNVEYKKYGVAAAARNQADWLIGMNLSRAFTLKAKRGGSNVLLTVGRVQTPTLAIVVKRDRDIENFKPISHYTINAKLKNHDNVSFLAAWQMKEDQPGLDEQGYLIDEEKINDVINKINNKPGIVKSFNKTPKKKYHPKVFSLSSLTLVASNKFGYSGVDVLNTCQSLYEKHKLTSYPRTDSCYLPTSQFIDAKRILSTLSDINPNYRSLIEKADTKIKSKTWDDSKTTAHHGIIPTLHSGDISKLSEMEKNIYDLIVRTYIAQFYPIHEYIRTSIDIDINGELFVTAGNVITVNGWKDIYQEESEDEKEDDQSLPLLNENDSINCNELIKKSLKTKASPSFTSGTLINAMSNIYRYVDDPEHKKILKDEDGLGTEATRAGVVNDLIKRGFLKEDGKKLVSTKLGRELIDALPNSVTNPVLTAIYERMLKSIENDTFTDNEFLIKQQEYIKQQVEKAKEGTLKIGHIPKISGIHKCDDCGKGLCRLSAKRAGTYYWRCSGFPDCQKTYFDNKGRPKK